MTTDSASYAARLEIDYPESLDRFTTFVRWILAIGVCTSLPATPYLVVG